MDGSNLIPVVETKKDIEKFLEERLKANEEEEDIIETILNKINSSQKYERLFISKHATFFPPFRDQILENGGENIDPRLFIALMVSKGVGSYAEYNNNGKINRVGQCEWGRGRSLRDVWMIFKTYYDCSFLDFMLLCLSGLKNPIDYKSRYGYLIRLEYFKCEDIRKYRIYTHTVNPTGYSGFLEYTGGFTEFKDKRGKFILGRRLFKYLDGLKLKTPIVKPTDEFRKLFL